MNFSAMAYPDTFIIGLVKHLGRRDASDVMIPYTDEPDVGIGDVITHKAGPREISLLVVDASFVEGGTLKVGTKHPHMLTLKVQNSTAQAHLPKPASTFSIGSISGTNVQIGDSNTLTVNITMKELAEAIGKSADPEARSALAAFLNNSTVANVIGVGATALMALAGAK